MDTKEKIEIINRHKYLIKSIARKYCQDDSILEDLIIVGEIACLNSLETFDKKKNTKLSTYLYKRIEGAIRDEIKTKYNFFGRNTQEKPIRLSEVENFLSYSIEDIILERSDNEETRKRLELLSKKEKQVLYLKYWEDMSFIEIAKKIGLKSESRISQIHKIALDKLKGMIEI